MVRVDITWVEENQLAELFALISMGLTDIWSYVYYTVILDHRSVLPAIFGSLSGKEKTKHLF